MAGLDCVGMVYAGYNTGPSNRGLIVPIGSCIGFDAGKRIALTASHVLESPPPSLSPRGAEIAPRFDCFLVGFAMAPSWEIFRVTDAVEILPEVTAVHLEAESLKGTPLPADLGHEIQSSPIKNLFPVYMVGYPASIQPLAFSPDEENLELRARARDVFPYGVSGVVARYFNESAPDFIDPGLLPAFTVDNGVVPGMSGGAVLAAPPLQGVVGLIVKNLEIPAQTATPGLKVVHTLAICTHELSV